MNKENAAIPIIFNPPDNSENQYIRILVSGIEKNNFIISPLEDLFKSRSHFQSIRLVHLNWFENLDESSKGAMWKSFLRKIVALIAIKSSGKKMVWTMHNRLSHEKGSGKLSNVLVNLLVKNSDAVVIHSAATEAVLKQSYPKFSGKILLIPHPHFIGTYGDKLDFSQKPHEPLRLLFMGAVKPYKNLELLIHIAKEFGDDIQLKIAGKPSSQTYAEDLRRLAAGEKQLDLRLGFVEDPEISRLIGESDLLILPYDMRSSLNSGTVLLAFSYGRTVICPRIGTIDELHHGKSGVFTYSYSSDSEHESKLREAIKEAVELKKHNPQALLQMGTRMMEHVKKENDPVKATQKLTKLYRDLLR